MKISNPKPAGAAEVWQDFQGIVHIDYADGCTVQGSDIESQVEQLTEIGVGKPCLVLLDIRRTRGVTREARELGAGERVAAVTKATAILVGSAISRVLGQFFVGLNRPPRPTKLFDDENAAIAWLRDFRDRSP